MSEQPNRSSVPETAGAAVAELVHCFACGRRIGLAPGPLPDDSEWCCEECAEGFGSVAEPYTPEDAT